MSCGATEKDFKFWMPLEVIKGKEGEMRVMGIASDENAKDLQGEKVFVDGLDTSYLVERGAFNWNHGKEASDILGEIDKADKRDGKLHVEGFLYPHVDQAKATWNLMRSMKDSGSKRKLGLSIEGKIKERLGKEVRKAWLKNVAITYNPINGGTWVDMLKSLEGLAFNKCEGKCDACKFVEKSGEQDKVVELLEKQPNPKDDKIHELANKLGLKPNELEEMIYDMLGDVISHGQGVEPDLKELEMGIKVEMEHTNFPSVAKWIAMAHLKELPDYYTRLATMEKQGKKALGEPVEKGQKTIIDARVENLPSEPAPSILEEVDRCPLCGKIIFPDGTCGCDSRDVPIETNQMDQENPLNPISLSIPESDIEKQLGSPASVGSGAAAGFEREEEKKKESKSHTPDVALKTEGGVDKAMSAGYDVAGATGGVSGSALREEDLDKKKKVTTYDERHLGLTKKDVKEMVKSKGYSDEISGRLTDAIFMMVELQKAHPHKYIKKLGTGLTAQYFYQMPKLGERLHEPTDNEWQHEKMRINQAFDKKNMEGFIATRMNRIADPQKMFAFARALEDENLHDEAVQAYKKLGEMGFQWLRVGKGLVGSAGSYAWVKTKEVGLAPKAPQESVEYTKQKNIELNKETFGDKKKVSEPPKAEKPELKEEVKKIEEETAKPVKEKVKTGLEKLKDEFNNVNVTSSTKTETKIGKRIEVAGRMKKPDISGIKVTSKERPVDYGNCGGLMEEKYGDARGQKSYESMIDVGNSGIFFVAGEEIQKEKRAMMNALGKTGELDNHDYQGLYKEWLNRLSTEKVVTGKESYNEKYFKNFGAADKAKESGFSDIEDEDLTAAGLIRKLEEIDESHHGVPRDDYNRMKKRIEAEGAKIPAHIRVQGKKYEGEGRLIEVETEKALLLYKPFEKSETYKPGSLGHSLSLLNRKGKSKVKEHHRIQSGHLIKIDKHRRHLHSDAELQKLLKQCVQNWMASGVRGNPFAKWLQKNDFDSYSKLSGMLGFPTQGEIEKGRGPDKGPRKKRQMSKKEEFRATGFFRNKGQAKKPVTTKDLMSM